MASDENIELTADLLAIAQTIDAYDAAIARAKERAVPEGLATAGQIHRAEITVLESTAATLRGQVSIRETLNRIDSTLRRLDAVVSVLAERALKDSDAGP